MDRNEWPRSSGTGGRDHPEQVADFVRNQWPTSPEYPYKASTEQDFECLLKKWYFWATHSRLDPIIKAANVIKKHWDGVLEWKKSQINNGILEGLNSIVQAAKAKARGFKTFRNFRIVVFLLTGNLNFKSLNPNVAIK